MKKLTNKKNNKGFSLVELIVVVLIMGIIAVALAPQVMKWVDKSRTSTDDSQMATLKSSIQIAYADYQSQHGAISGGVAQTTLDKKATITAVNANLANCIDEVLGGEYPKTQAGGYFKFEISSDGKVTISK